ncbi:MAG: hypothetical protein KC431_23825 [Myxococcales bacterium]|nr:hypothetical protein [Myxococcales bacterium]
MCVVLSFLNYLPFSKHIHVLGSGPNILLRHQGQRGIMPKLELMPPEPAEDEEVAGGTKIRRARVVGAAVAKACLDKGITKVVFDRNGYLYHGRVRALAEAAREAGLDF